MYQLEHASAVILLDSIIKGGAQYLPVLRQTTTSMRRSDKYSGALIRSLRPSVMLHSIDCHGSSTTPHTRLGVQPTFR